MTGSLIPDLFRRALDATGNAVPGAKANFYLTGTVTRRPTYTTAALSVQNANPVVADSGGLFPPIYLDPAITYRRVLTTSTGAQIIDDDPIAGSAASPGVSVLGFGADPTGVADSTALILAAEASLTAGQALYFPAGTYRFTSALSSIRQGFCWVGDGKGQSILLYNGASTTIDLLAVGNGSATIKNVTLAGLTLRSSTTMTAGAGLHLYKVAHAEIDFDLQGQTGYEDIGNTLWNGAWFQEVDDIKYAFKGVFAQNEGVMVNGSVGAGLKAGLWLLDGGKIGRCALAIHCGGAFGGLNIGAIDLGVNGRNILIDRALAAETNREVFLHGPSVDLTTTGANITIDDPGGVLFQTSGSTWIASGATHGVWVKQCQGRVLLNGRIYQNGLVSTGDGVRVDDALAQVQVLAQIHNNSGWGVNPNVASNNVLVNSSLIRDNTLGAINPAHPSVIPMIGLWETLSYLNVTGQATFGDAAYYAQLQTGNPVIGVDANDYYTYDRTANEHQWLIGNSLALKLAATGVILYAGGTAVGTFANGTFVANGTIKTIDTVVASLPSAATVGRGARAFVHDATGTTLGAAVTGGGTTPVPVYSDGAQWLIG